MKKELCSLVIVKGEKQISSKKQNHLKKNEFCAIIISFGQFKYATELSDKEKPRLDKKGVFVVVRENILQKSQL